MGPIIDRSYRLHELLGQGGMGTVYRATELVTGNNIALKLVSSQNTGKQQCSLSHDISYRLALTREFQTLASLHHPHVIRVQSYGFDEQYGSYYTMELLESPQSLLEASREQSPTRMVELLAQLLRGLAYVHQRGILHRDIKPSNVLISRGEVKLLDFGIAVQAKREVALAGTVEYLAPELLLGQPPSQASDLYSVGVLAYQMLSGYFPYNRTSMTQILQGILGTQSELTLPPTAMKMVQQYRSRPRDLVSAQEALTRAGLTVLEEEAGGAGTEWRGEVRGPLGDVLKRLVAKKPQERYGDAPSVLKDLAMAMQIELPVETAATRESFLQATQLVGREAELVKLQAGLADAERGQGRGFLVGGESGVGKSRLIQELRTLALVYGFWVAEGQSTTEQGGYYQEWLPLVRALGFRVEMSGEEAAVLKEVLPELETLLGRPVGEPARVSPQEVQARLARTVEGLLKRLDKPLLLILEDMQWMRSESLGLLLRLSEHLGKIPVLLIGTYRSDESPSLPQTLSGLEELRLQRLAAEEIGRLSASILGVAGEQQELIHYLERQTEGNVFFLIEVLRALAESTGALDRIGQGELRESVLTAGIERIVEGRLDRLPESFRPLLEFAAMYGRRLDLSVLDRAFAEMPLRGFLIECANVAVLESQGSEWRFAHDKLRETILRHLSNERRRQLHREVAETTEVVYVGAAREVLSAKLAYHFQEAGVFERAFRYYVQAGDSAAKLEIYGEARVHYEAAKRMAEQLPDSADVKRTRVEVLLKQVIVSLINEPLEKLLSWLREAQGLLEQLFSARETDPADRLRLARVDYYHGRVYHYAGQPKAALHYYQKVLPVAQEFADEELLVMPSFVIGTALVAQGQFGRGLKLLSQTIEPIFKYLGTSVDSIRCLGYTGIALAAAGNCQRALAELERLRRRVQSIEQPIIQGTALIFELVIFGMIRDWPMVLQVGAQLLALGRRTGERMFQYGPLDYLAWGQSWLGQHAQALKSRAEAAELRRSVGGGIIADWFEAFEAEILLHAGRPVEALRQAEKVAKTSAAAGLHFSQAIVERVWGCALVRLGSPLPEADQHFLSSLEVCRSGEQVMNAAQTELWWGRMCRERGEEALAQAHLTEAFGIMEAGGYEHGLAEAHRIANAPLAAEPGNQG